MKAPKKKASANVKKTLYRVGMPGVFWAYQWRMNRDGGKKAVANDGHRNGIRWRKQSMDVEGRQ